VYLQELVSLGAAAWSKADPLTNGGRHLTPREFHTLLLEAAAAASGDDGSGCTGAADDAGVKPIVLVDARNAYETEIGR